MKKALIIYLLTLTPIVSFITGCQTQRDISNNANVFIKDLRKIARDACNLPDHDRLIILNIDKAQTVFEVTNSNFMALSNIPASYVEEMSILMNDTGNFDTKYDIIIILTLKKRALEILNGELKEKFK